MSARPDSEFTILGRARSYVRQGDDLRLAATRAVRGHDFEGRYTARIYDLLAAEARAAGLCDSCGYARWLSPNQPGPCNCSLAVRQERKSKEPHPA